MLGKTDPLIAPFLYTCPPGKKRKKKKKKKKMVRARPGFEPGTSRTLSENHTPRPTSHPEERSWNGPFCLINRMTFPGSARVSPKKKKKNATCFLPGSNRRPCPCEGHVITTTLRKQMEVQRSRLVFPTRALQWIQASPARVKAIGLMAQRITRLTTDQKIAGSNPAEIVLFRRWEPNRFGRRKKISAPPGGLEPPTFRLTAERANQLRHGGLIPPGARIRNQSSITGPARCM